MWMRSPRGRAQSQHRGTHGVMFGCRRRSGPSSGRKTRTGRAWQGLGSEGQSAREGCRWRRTTMVAVAGNARVVGDFDEDLSLES